MTIIMPKLKFSPLAFWLVKVYQLDVDASRLNE